MLDGTTVLVIEEEFLIALDIQRMLETLHAGQILFARSAQEAQALHQHWPNVTLALVEVTLNRQSTLQLVQSLVSSGIAVVLCSTDTGLLRRFPQFAHLPMVAKPMAETDLVRAIHQVFKLRS